MKVFIVTDEAFPNGMASTRRIRCYARALMLAGMEVEVLCFHRTEVSGIKPANTEACGSFDGIPFKYVGGTPLRESSLLRRKFNDWKDKISTLIYLKKELSKEDAILYYSVNQFPLLTFAGCKVYRDLCEYPYATRKIDRFTEFRCHLYMSTLFRLYDGAICISRPLYDLALRYKPDGHHMIAPIFVDPQEWDFSGSSPVDFPYIFHSGSLDNQKDGFCSTLKAFEAALPSLPSDLKYLFTGNTDSAECSTERISFLGYLQKDRLCDYLANARCFILNKPDNLQNRHCFPTKLGEYLLSGNPVIVNDKCVASEYLDENSAYIFKTGDDESLTSQIIKLFSDMDEARLKGQAGREVCLKNFSIMHQSDKLKEYFCK